MKQYSFSSSLLLRTPLYSVEKYENADYAFILKTEEFKIALLLASNAFFNELRKKDFDYNLLNEKQQHTIKKYINRSSFRSTPFGIFSSFSLVDWTNQEETNIVLAKPDPYIRLDFSILEMLWEKYVKYNVEDFSKFQTNQSFYFSKTDLRYIKTEVEANAERLFSMVSISKNAILKKVLKFCQSSRSHNEIASFLMQEVGVNEPEAVSFIRELIKQQIIVSNLAPNITGKDYTHFFFKHLHECPELRDLKLQIEELSSGYSVKLCSLLEIANELNKQLSLKNNTNHYYSIAEKKVLSGGISSKHQEQIKDGLFCLDLLSKVTVNDDLNKFKTAFKEKYESGEVTLLEVLDSQFGIGYGAFDKIKNHYGLSDNNTATSQQNSHIDAKNEFVESLLKNWQLKNDHDAGFQLEITDDHLRKITTNKNECLPPSISVIFRLIDEKIFIESAGGTSAISLLGRFSSSLEVYNLAKQIAEGEQKSNKDIIFAEVAHICNLHSANINRRQHLHDYEIPVLTNSVLESSRKIDLNDILVSVLNDTVILRSIKLNKRIIPRLSSAFNYTKSSFPVFRFLCDIQNQNLKTSFSFSLSSHLPGLRFYPRILYKSCILQVAEWHVEAKELDSFHERKPSEVFRLFHEFAKEINLPRYFAYTLSDNFLVYDAQRIEDILFLLNEVKNKGVIVLKEFPFIQEDNVVEDKFHQKFLPQFVASMYLNEEVYKSEKEANYKMNKASSIKDTKEWIYFKVYCHPLSSDIILCDYLIPLVKKHIKSSTIREWFWIRYNDPQYHIRFRLQVSKNMRSSIFEDFSTCITKLSFNKLINYFVTDIYKQEIDRYSLYLIKDVETVFTSSSNIVGRFLKIKGILNYNDNKVVIEAVLSINEILVAFGLSYSERMQLCKSQFDQFYIEFDSPKSLKPEIEKLYKKLSDDIVSIFNCNKSRNSYNFLKRDIFNLIHEFKVKKVKDVTLTKLAVDIIHMHLNRLYFDNQRYLEMATYYILYRTLNTEIHKSKAVHVSEAV